MSPRVAILISGRGSNMLAILDAADAEGWDAEFVLVLSNKPGAPGLERAAERGIPTAVVDHRAYGRARRAEFDAALARAVADSGADWVVLAGFMRILGPGFVQPFSGRIVNIHPSLLPLHPGLRTHEAALAAGDAEHGCTVHLVDASLDGGPVLGQARVPVLPGDDADTLAARVLVEEHRLYPAVLKALLDGTHTIDSNQPMALAAHP